MFETFATSRYGKIAVLDSGGSGLPLLMLHGAGASKGVFFRQFGSLTAQKHRVVSIDLLGHGRSDRAVEPEQAYTLEGFATGVIDVLNFMGIERIAIFGWSLGGHIAIELLRDHPDRLAGIMLTGTPIAARGPLGMLRAFHLRKEMLFSSKPTYTASETERFARLCYAEGVTPGLIDDIVCSDGRCRPVIARSLLSGADQQAVVTSSPLPIAVVNGALEPIARLSHLEGLHYRQLWRGKCHTIAAAGHAPFLQKPSAFNLLLNSFVRDAAVVGHDVSVQQRASA